MAPDSAALAHAAAGIALPPGLVLILAGLALTALKGRVRERLVLVAPLVALALVWLVPDGSSLNYRWLGFEIQPLRADPLARLFGTVFSIMAFAGGLFGLRQENRMEAPAAFVYAGAALGVVFAGDLITLFTFWEVMALASTLVILAGGASAKGAAQRYVVIHLFGGVLLMAGMAGHVAETGSTLFSAMKADSWAHWLLLAGFLLNTGAPPLSAWVGDAYPEASWSGTVYLSAFTTKTAVLVLMRGFPGEHILVWFGLFMVFYGIVYAILENDMRRILAYSIVNQVGFMVVGIGIGTELALNGTAAHAFVHIIYKALLLMSAGAVLYRTGERNCTELGGLFRTMPFTAIAGIVGALSISAFPLTSGFVAKAMISDGAAEEHMALVWFLLTAATAGVFLHAGIKFPWFVFFQKDSGLRPAEAPASMRWAMALMAALCLIIGVFPDLLYRLLPFPVHFEPYTGSHVVSQLQLLLFSGLAFFLMLGWLKRTRTITLDVDWLWRKAGPAAVRVVGGWLGHASLAALARVEIGARRLLAGIYRHHGPGGALARTWPTGSMALWAALLLAAYLLLYYL